MCCKRGVQPEGEAQPETKRCCFCCCKRPIKPKKEENPFKSYKDRKCTDCLFCIVFIVFWLGMIIISAIGFTGGDPSELIYGTDYQGNLCGTDGRGKRIYFPRITEDLRDFSINAEITNPLDITLFGVCVDSCPDINDVVCTGATATAQLAAAKTATGEANDADTVVACQESNHWSTAGCNAVRSECWIVPLNTTEFFFRCVWVRTTVAPDPDVKCLSPPSLAGRSDLSADEWEQCITKETTQTETETREAQENPLLDLIYSAAALFGRFMADVEKALPVIIVCGLFVSFIAGFIWLVFMKLCASFLVWLTIWLVFIMLVCVTLVGYWKAGILTQNTLNSATGSFNDATGADVSVKAPNELTAADEDLQQRWKYFAFVMTGICVVYLVLLMFLRRSIKVAIGVIKEASTAIRKMWSLLFYPVVSFVFLLVFVVYWVVALAFIASTGEDEISNNAVTTSASNYYDTAPNLLCPTKNDTSTGQTVVLTQAEVDADPSLNCTELLAAAEFVPDNAKRYMLIYHLFGLFWTSNFIVGMGIMIVSGAVSKWYFTRDKKNALPRHPCCSSTKRACRYHLGTVAFGSLLIALVQMIRATLAYLDNKTETLKNKSKIWACISKCIACCLWCFEKCLQYMTKYAYIVVAMKGVSFCSAGRQVIGIFMTNPKQIATTEVITTFLFLIGKVFVVTLSSLLAFAWFEKGSNYQEGEDDELDSMLIPLGIVAILAYVVAKIFLDVYHLAIQTILTCYFEDLATHKGTADDPYFMTASLAKAIGHAVHEVKKLEEEEEGDVKKVDGAGGAGAAPADNSVPQQQPQQMPMQQAPAQAYAPQPQAFPQPGAGYAPPQHPGQAYAAPPQPGYGPPQGAYHAPPQPGYIA